MAPKPCPTDSCKHCQYLEKTLARKQQLIHILKNLLKTKDNHAFSGQQLLALRAKGLETTESLKREFVQLVTSVNHNVQQHTRERKKFEDLKASVQDQDSVVAHQEFQIKQLYARIHAKESELKKVEDQFRSYQLLQLKNCTCGAQKTKKKLRGRPPLPSELPSASTSVYQPTPGLIPDGVLTPASSVTPVRPGTVSSPMIAWLNDVCSIGSASPSGSPVDDSPLNGLADTPPLSNQPQDANDPNCSALSDSICDDTPTAPKESVASSGSNLESSKVEKMNSLPSLMESPVRSKVEWGSGNPSIFDLPADDLSIRVESHASKESSPFDQPSTAPKTEVLQVSNDGNSTVESNDMIGDHVSDTSPGTTLTCDRVSKEVPSEGRKPFLNIFRSPSEVQNGVCKLLGTIAGASVVGEASPKRVVSLESFLENLSSFAKTRETDIVKSVALNEVPACTMTPTLKSSSPHPGSGVEESSKDTECGMTQGVDSACEDFKTSLPMVSPIKTPPETPTKISPASAKSSGPSPRVNSDAPERKLRQRKTPGPVVKSSSSVEELSRASESDTVSEGEMSAGQSSGTETILPTLSPFKTFSETPSQLSPRSTKASSPGPEVKSEGLERKIRQRRTSSPVVKSFSSVEEINRTSECDTIPEGETACQGSQFETLLPTVSPFKTPTKISPTTKASFPDTKANSEGSGRKLRRRKTPSPMLVSPLKKYTTRSTTSLRASVVETKDFKNRATSGKAYKTKNMIKEQLADGSIGGNDPAPVQETEPPVESGIILQAYSYGSIPTKGTCDDGSMVSDESDFPNEPKPVAKQLPEERTRTVGRDSITETLKDHIEDQCESQVAHSMACHQPVRAGVLNDISRPESVDSPYFQGFNDVDCDRASEERKRHLDWLRRRCPELKKTDCRVPAIGTKLSWQTPFAKPSTSKDWTQSTASSSRPIFNVERFTSFSDLLTAESARGSWTAIRPEDADDVTGSLCWSFKLLSVEPTDQSSGNFFHGFIRKEVKIENDGDGFGQFFDSGRCKHGVIKIEQEDTYLMPTPSVGRRGVQPGSLRSNLVRGASTRRPNEATDFVDLSCPEDECRDRCSCNLHFGKRRKNLPLPAACARNEGRFHGPGAPEERFQPFKPEERPSCRFSGFVPSFEPQVFGHGPAWSRYRGQNETQGGFELKKPFSLAPSKLSCQLDPVRSENSTNILSRRQVTSSSTHSKVAMVLESPPKTARNSIAIDKESLSKRSLDRPGKRRTPSPKKRSPGTVDVSVSIACGRLKSTHYSAQSEVAVIPWIPPKTAKNPFAIDKESCPKRSLDRPREHQIPLPNKHSPGSAEVSASITCGLLQTCSAQSEVGVIPRSPPAKASIALDKESWPKRIPDMPREYETPSPKKGSPGSADISASSSCGPPQVITCLGQSEVAVIPGSPPATSRASIDIEEKSSPARSPGRTPDRSREHHEPSPKKHSPGTDNIETSSSCSPPQVTPHSPQSEVAVIPGSPPKTANALISIDEESLPKKSPRTTPDKLSRSGQRRTPSPKKRSPATADISTSSSCTRTGITSHSPQLEVAVIPESHPKIDGESLPGTTPDKLDRSNQLRTGSPKKRCAEDILAPSNSTSGWLGCGSQETHVMMAETRPSFSTPPSDESPVKSKNSKAKLDSSATFKRCVLQGRFPPKKTLAGKKPHWEEPEKSLPLVPSESEASDKVSSEEDSPEPCQKKRRIAHSSLKIEHSRSKWLEPLIAIDEKIEEEVPKKMSETTAHKLNGSEDLQTPHPNQSRSATDVLAAVASDEACTICNRTVLLCSCEIEKTLGEMTAVPAPLSPICCSPEPRELPECVQPPVVPFADAAPSSVAMETSVKEERIVASSSNSSSQQATVAEPVPRQTVPERQAQFSIAVSLSESSSNESETEFDEDISTDLRTANTVAETNVKIPLKVELCNSEPETFATSSVDQLHEVLVEDKPPVGFQDYSSGTFEHDHVEESEPKIGTKKEPRETQGTSKREPEEKPVLTVPRDMNIRNKVAENEGSPRRVTRNSKVSSVFTAQSKRKENPELIGLSDLNISAEVAEHKVIPRRVTRRSSSIADLSADNELGSPLNKSVRKALRPRENRVDKNNSTEELKKKAIGAIVPDSGRMTRRRISEKLCTTSSDPECQPLKSKGALNHAIRDAADEREAPRVLFKRPVSSNSSEKYVGTTVRKRRLGNAPSIVKIGDDEKAEFSPVENAKTSVREHCEEASQSGDCLQPSETTNEEAAQAPSGSLTGSISPELSLPDRDQQSILTSSVNSLKLDLKHWNSFKGSVVEGVVTVRRSKTLSSGGDGSETGKRTLHSAQSTGKISEPLSGVDSEKFVPENSAKEPSRIACYPQPDKMQPDKNMSSNSTSVEPSEFKPSDTGSGSAKFEGTRLNGSRSPNTCGVENIAKLNGLPSVATLKTEPENWDTSNLNSRRNSGNSARSQLLSHLERFFRKDASTNPVQQTAKSETVGMDEPATPLALPSPTLNIMENTKSDSDEESDQEMVIDCHSESEAVTEETSSQPGHVVSSYPPPTAPSPTQSVPPEHQDDSSLYPKVVGFYTSVEPTETESSEAAKSLIPHLVEVVRRQVPEEEVVACSINIIPFATFYPLPGEKPKPKNMKLNEKTEESIKNCVNEYFVTRYTSASRDKAKAALSKWPAYHVARAICQVVAESKVKHPPKPKDPTDFLTPTHNKAVLLIGALADGNLGYFQSVLTVIEGNLIESPMKGEGCSNATSYINLATVYAMVCRVYGFVLRAQTFIYDVLYTRQLTVFLIMYRIICFCPTAFPFASSKMGPLGFTVGYLIMKQGIYQSLPDNVLATYSVNVLRLKLLHKHGYEFPPDLTRDGVADELFSKIMYRGSDKAIVLLCKSQGYKWTHSISQKHLFPVLNQWIAGNERDEEKVARYISILGQVSRGFAEAICPSFVGRSLHVLTTIVQQNPGLLIAEAVAEALSHFQRLDCDGVAKILSTWVPHDYRVSLTCLKYVKRIVSMKSPAYWRRFIS